MLPSPPIDATPFGSAASTSSGSRTMAAMRTVGCGPWGPPVGSWASYWAAL